MRRETTPAIFNQMSKEAILRETDMWIIALLMEPQRVEPQHRDYTTALIQNRNRIAKFFDLPKRDFKALTKTRGLDNADTFGRLS